MANPWLRATRLLQRMPFALQRWRAVPRVFSSESLLRSELFSAEQMADHGCVLAKLHRVSQLPADDALLVRLSDNERTLSSSCAALASTLPASRRDMPAAQWLLDNFYLVEAHIRIAKSHLPPGYSASCRVWITVHPAVYRGSMTLPCKPSPTVMGGSTEKA